MPRDLSSDGSYRHEVRRRTRWGVGALVAGLHALALVLLVRALAPQLGERVLRPVTEAFNVALPPEPPPPPPPPPPASSAVAEPTGRAAPAGKRAAPRPIAAPAPRLVLSTQAAPAVAAIGAADSAGARDRGQGTGAGGSGQGLGAGGTGTGAGGAMRAVKVAGDIVSARDYPKATRALRLGSSVTIALTVGVDGRPSACRVLRASRDPEADRITCDLAMERFRFRPARDDAGQPVVSTYGWQQRWFTPGTE